MLLLLIIGLQAQKKYPKKVFIAPVDYKMTLSGTFGELRSNHLHSGIDIRTDAKIGKKIYAIADGYVSRIKVSPFGFGKAVYIRHSNGYTSVYGHLNRFTKEISRYTKEQQYKKKSFAVDLYLKPGQIEVHQGEVIAFSGNSGSSQGPHLHFEIRESASQKPLNPLLFGFEIKDYTRPKIKGIKIYPLTKRAKINGKHKALEVKAAGWGEKHRPADGKTIRVSGEIGFGINTYDLLNDAPNKNGVYEVSLFIDSKLIYQHQFEKFSFAETRYVNSLIDYAHYIDHKRRYQRSIHDPGNKISVIKKAVNDGSILFDADKVHELEYVVKDVYGNVSRFKCKLKASKADAAKPEPKKGANWFDYAKANSINQDDLSLNFKAGTFYTSFNFYLKKMKASKDYYSDLFHIHKEQVPVHKSFKIKIKTKKLPAKLQSKALIVCLNGKDPNPKGGKFVDGFVETTSKELGKYAIMVDTKPPKITALNIHNGKKIKGYKKISFKVKDDLSGINKYVGKLNGKWILVEFDPKTDKMFYLVDSRMKKGKNKFELMVEDDRGNQANYSATVVY